MSVDSRFGNFYSFVRGCITGSGYARPIIQLVRQIGRYSSPNQYMCLSSLYILTKVATPEHDCSSVQSEPGSYGYRPTPVRLDSRIVTVG
jgi:hypothetical protein